ncbi:MAG: hypothetical protein ACRDRU_24015 [Pseudonocardiaceae bacterium]
MPRHRLVKRRGSTPRRRVRVVDMVDRRTRVTHLMTPDAAEAGHSPGGRYLALCGAELTPAAMVEPGCGYCLPCRSFHQLSAQWTPADETAPTS